MAIAAVKGAPDALAQFVAQCTRLRDRSDWPQRIAAALRDLLRQQDIGDLIRQQFTGASEIAVFHNDPVLTIYAVRSAGGLRGPPHDHATAAVVGLIEGSEQFKLYRREGTRCIETQTHRVSAPHVAVLDDDVVHALWSDPSQSSLSLHIYGNEHFNEPRRSLWDPNGLERVPFDFGSQIRWTRELTNAARTGLASAG